MCEDLSLVGLLVDMNNLEGLLWLEIRIAPGYGIIVSGHCRIPELPEITGIGGLKLKVLISFGTCIN